MKDGLLIDTNLLLVMIIGGVDEGRYIKKSKRLGSFCIEDYDTLWETVKDYEDIFITPYIAAEVSNLIDLKDEARVKAFEIARIIFSKCKQAKTFISDDCKGDTFLKLGLTDNSIVTLSKNVHVLTKDYNLAGRIDKINPGMVTLYISCKD